VQRASVFREAQRMDEALEAMRAAAKQNPGDPRAAFGVAQMAFECWQPAADLFAAARQLIPDHPDLIRNHALALAAEGEGAAAQALLETTLSANPGWLDGHRTLAVMRITAGEGAGFDRSFAAACHKAPTNAALRMAYFQQQATLKNWDAARTILSEAQAAIPGNRSLTMAELFLDAETDGGADLSARFAEFSAMADPGMDLCHVRYLLRRGDPAGAEAIAARHKGTPSARMFWPYLALCWRLQADARATWLDGDPLYAAPYDLDFSPAELATLAHVLRGLHRLRAPYPEQSVRGGTQTDRQLFFHPDPAIQSARAKIAAAVQSHIAQLPKADASHPLLGQPRDGPLHFAGSWSVRLSGKGYHSSHTHVLGWISSAFYVALPDAPGDAPSGFLALGAPPPELDLGLAPYRHVEPRPGRLVLFPSYLWHATEPFQSGERITMAFDAMLTARHS
jgi:tetratricopeptide (TPR) repeat protein